MPKDIIQFQVVNIGNGVQVVWVLTRDGKIYYRNPQVGGSKWQEYIGN